MKISFDVWGVYSIYIYIYVCIYESTWIRIFILRPGASPNTFHPCSLYQRIIGTLTQLSEHPILRNAKLTHDIPSTLAHRTSALDMIAQQSCMRDLAANKSTSAGTVAVIIVFVVVIVVATGADTAQQGRVPGPVGVQDLQQVRDVEGVAARESD